MFFHHHLLLFIPSPSHFTRCFFFFFKHHLWNLVIFFFVFQMDLVQHSDGSQNSMISMVSRQPWPRADWGSEKLPKNCCRKLVCSWDISRKAMNLTVANGTINLFKISTSKSSHQKMAMFQNYLSLLDSEYIYIHTYTYTYVYIYIYIMMTMMMMMMTTTTTTMMMMIYAWRMWFPQVCVVILLA